MFTDSSAKAGPSTMAGTRAQQKAFMVGEIPLLYTCSTSRTYVQSSRIQKLTTEVAETNARRKNEEEDEEM